MRKIILLSLGLFLGWATFPLVSAYQAEVDFTGYSYKELLSHIYNSLNEIQTNVRDEVTLLTEIRNELRLQRESRTACVDPASYPLDK